MSAIYRMSWAPCLRLAMRRSMSRRCSGSRSGRFGSPKNVLGRPTLRFVMVYTGKKVRSHSSVSVQLYMLMLLTHCIARRLW